MSLCPRHAAFIRLFHRSRLHRHAPWVAYGCGHIHSCGLIELLIAKIRRGMRRNAIAVDSHKSCGTDTDDGFF